MMLRSARKQAVKNANAVQSIDANSSVLPKKDKSAEPGFEPGNKILARSNKWLNVLYKAEVVRIEEKDGVPGYFIAWLSQNEDGAFPDEWIPRSWAFKYSRQREAEEKRREAALISKLTPAEKAEVEREWSARRARQRAAQASKSQQEPPSKKARKTSSTCSAQKVRQQQPPAPKKTRNGRVDRATAPSDPPAPNPYSRVYRTPKRQRLLSPAPSLHGNGSPTVGQNAQDPPREPSVHESSTSSTTNDVAGNIELMNEALLDDPDHLDAAIPSDDMVNAFNEALHEEFDPLNEGIPADQIETSEGLIDGNGEEAGTPLITGTVEVQDLTNSNSPVLALFRDRRGKSLPIDFSTVLVKGPSPPVKIVEAAAQTEQQDTSGVAEVEVALDEQPAAQQPQIAAAVAVPPPPSVDAEAQTEPQNTIGVAEVPMEVAGDDRAETESAAAAAAIASPPPINQSAAAGATGTNRPSPPAALVDASAQTEQQLQVAIGVQAGEDSMDSEDEQQDASADQQPQIAADRAEIEPADAAAAPPSPSDQSGATATRGPSGLVDASAQTELQLLPPTNQDSARDVDFAMKDPTPIVVMDRDWNFLFNVNICLAHHTRPQDDSFKIELMAAISNLAQNLGVPMYGAQAVTLANGQRPPFGQLIFMAPARDIDMHAALQVWLWHFNDFIASAIKAAIYQKLKVMILSRGAVPAELEQVLSNW